MKIWQLVKRLFKEFKDLFTFLYKKCERLNLEDSVYSSGAFIWHVTLIIWKEYRCMHPLQSWNSLLLQQNVHDDHIESYKILKNIDWSKLSVLSTCHHTRGHSMKLFHPTSYQHVEPLARRDSWLLLLCITLH